MKTQLVVSAAIALSTLSALPAAAQTISVKAGYTNVLLDTDTLSSVGITVTGIGGATDSSQLLPGGVKFPIDPASDFLYTETAVLPVSGSIGHFGTVLLNIGSPAADIGDIEIGDFTIGYDPSRVNGSGFFVEDTAAGLGIVFDIALTGVNEASTSKLNVSGDLLLGPELAETLNLSSLAGADIGDAIIDGAIPEPSTALLALCGIAGSATLRRRPGERHRCG